MSIKSQKSLNEECSEIFERSYSVRSASDESLSGDDDDETLAKELMRKMNPRVLSKLKKCFKKNKERARNIDIDRRVEEVMRSAAAEEGIEFASSHPPPQDTLWLDESAFVSAVNNIYGHHKYATHAEKLFQLVDRFSHGRIWWGQLLSRLVDAGAMRLTNRADTWVPIPEPLAKRLHHCKRETIVKIVSIEREDSFCYVAVSRGGRVGIYDGELHLLHSYEVFYHRTGLRKRVKNCWVTDSVYLSDVKYLFICASDRSLTVYDATTLSHTPLHCITGLPNIPTCATYRSSRDGGLESNSELALGDARGDILRLTFHHPRLQMFHSMTADCINYYYWMELFSPPHTTHVSISKCRRPHARAVKRIAYARDGDILVSCSHDNAVSIRIKHTIGKLDDYVFKTQRGVTCFAWVERARTLALCTGGSVLLWTLSNCPSRHNSTLIPPHSPPTRALDIACILCSRLLLVYYENCTVHIWDLDEECLLQTLKIKFPFLGVLGKKVEFGTYCIFPGPPRKKIQKHFTEDLDVVSPRGSSVYQGSTGGLMLASDAEEDRQSKDVDAENQRFNNSEILLTCCDYVCVVSMRQKDGDILPPPGDTLQPRRPSVWDLTVESLFNETPPSSSVPKDSFSSQFLAPSTANPPLQDLDTLLENAGLPGILEKDFVLMQGLKHDLCTKLAAMMAHKESMVNAVNAGAPYLALKTYEPDQIKPVDERTEEYQRIMKLFPSSSLAGTPTLSRSSTPRNSRSTKL